ncbi:hypothetical protein NG868_10925 [Enterococcus hirae]|uniref:hypothetical protein n=1 Tax=Enterococcus hirae TaxID=1354 RepID=UPI00209181C6|nr:hypothetical protein [Enterococcus hirae]MCO5491478.1 hypothetical protein [Enterococcus hirae]
MKFTQIQKIHVNPNVGNVNRHNDYRTIQRIFEKSAYNYYVHLTDLFEREPLRYAEIENIIFEKYKIEGPSLLDALKREGKGFQRSELLCANEGFRKSVISALFIECQKESRMEIIANYYKNGNDIVETTFPDFSRLIGENNRREKEAFEQREKKRIEVKRLNAIHKGLSHNKKINVIDTRSISQSILNLSVYT